MTAVKNGSFRGMLQAGRITEPAEGPGLQDLEPPSAQAPDEAHVREDRDRAGEAFGGDAQRPWNSRDATAGAQDQPPLVRRRSLARARPRG